MNNFDCLTTYTNDSIFIENEKQLKKYQKKLRQSKNILKIRQFEQAINEYHSRCEKKNTLKIAKKKKHIVESDDDILNKAIQENKKFNIMIESDKQIKQQRRLQHIQCVNRKTIKRKISCHKQQCVKKYFMKWKSVNQYIQCKKNNIIDMFQHSRKWLVLKNIIKQWKIYSDCVIKYANMVKKFKYNQENNIFKSIINKWKFHSDRMKIRYDLKCGYFLGKWIPKKRLVIPFVYWKKYTLRTQCNICYERHKKNDIIETNCGHEFCSGCIDNWKNICFRKYEDATCPLCRQVFEYQSWKSGIFEFY
jgi:hypothetical protein